MIARIEDLDHWNILIREIDVELNGDKYIEKMKSLKIFIKNFKYGKLSINRLYSDIVHSIVDERNELQSLTLINEELSLLLSPDNKKEL